jgi:hypothetical protein
MIPAQQFEFVFFCFLVFITLVTFIHSLSTEYGTGSNKLFNMFIGYSSLFFICLLIGSRPIDGVFTDMMTYANMFERIKSEYVDAFDKPDFLFFIFTKFWAVNFDLNSYFFICALLYITPLWFASKNLFGKSAGYCFLFLIVSFSFWDYGVNGIRNGLASSFFILGLSCKSKYLKYFIFLMAISIHNSIILPVAAYILVIKYRNTYKLIYAWVGAILFSFFSGTFLTSLLKTLAFGNERIEKYATMTVDTSKFSSSGFRLDFIIYSCLPILFSLYFMKYYKFQSAKFNQILNTYILTNLCWVLINSIAYSNRFAYLSWCFMPLIIAFPLLRENCRIKNRHLIISSTLCGYLILTIILRFK